MLSLAIVRLSDDKCHAMLCELRWSSTEIVVFPKCQVQNKAYYITCRKQ
ncbi:transposase [Bartonella sp. MR30HLJHH]